MAVALGPELDVVALERLVEVDAHEGPVYVAAEDALYFTTLPRDLRVDVERLEVASGRVTTIRADANMANGMTLARDGRLLVCEQGTREEPARIAALDRATGEAETIVDAWRGLPLNSPNDVVVVADGAIWFTDPSYGFLQGYRPQPQPGDYVYRHDPATGRTDVVADSFDKPNGLAFSPDESVLYVAATAARTTSRARTTRGGRITSSRSTFVTDAGSRTSGCSQSSRPVSRTASRSTAKAASTRHRSAAFRSSTSRAT
jgi:sugar lactone lactonase YvrE